jgi:NAD(P)H dehydrogenase (quinone)
MKHAVILAHPAAKSLNAAIAESYAEAVRKAGDEVVVRDLYAMGFDPCLKAEEIPGPGEPRFGRDVVDERARLADVDVFAFVYPLWFNAPPAILKGYVDRVFGMGFGFKPGFGGTEPALRGRRMISFTTSGAPDFWVKETGALETLSRLFDAHLAGVCGLEVADHLHFGGMVSDIGREAVEDVLSRVRDAAARMASNPAAARAG